MSERTELILLILRNHLAAACWRRPEQGLGVVYDALVGAVVGIGEEDVPVLRQRVRVDGKAVILAGDKAAICSLVYAGLIVTTVPVPERQEVEN